MQTGPPVGSARRRPRLSLDKQVSGCESSSPAATRGRCFIHLGPLGSRITSTGPTTQPPVAGFPGMTLGKAGRFPTPWARAPGGAGCDQHADGDSQTRVAIHDSSPLPIGQPTRCLARGRQGGDFQSATAGTHGLAADSRRSPTDRLWRCWFLTLVTRNRMVWDVMPPHRALRRDNGCISRRKHRRTEDYREYENVLPARALVGPSRQTITSRPFPLPR